MQQLLAKGEGVRFLGRGGPDAKPRRLGMPGNAQPTAPLDRPQAKVNREAIALKNLFQAGR
jgi:hypothetical protein